MDQAGIAAYFLVGYCIIKMAPTVSKGDSTSYFYYLVFMSPHTL